MGRKAQDLVKRFDPDVIISKWNSLIESVINSERKNILNFNLISYKSDDKISNLNKAIFQYNNIISSIIYKMNQCKIDELTNNKPCNNCKKNSNSLLFFITKLLNLERKLLISLRENGIKITIIKIKRKIITKLRNF